MSSILTNMSAMTAVQNLAATQKSLADVQSQISSGLKVASAKDNAGYFSIATTMRMNIGNLSAVSDALNLGSSVVSTSTSALSSITSVLQSISKALVSASQPGTDLNSINTQIASLRTQLANSVATSSFNGVNLLDGSTSNTNNGQVQFVAGVSGSGANTTVNTLTVNTATTNFQGAAYNNTGTSTLNAYAAAFSKNTTAQAALSTAQSNNATAYNALSSAILSLTGSDLGNASGTQAAVTTANSTAAFQAVFGKGASMTFSGSTATVTGITSDGLAGKLLGSTGTGEQLTLTLGTGTGANADGASLTSYANGTGSTDGTLTALYGAGATQATASATTGAYGQAATAQTNLGTATAALTTSDSVVANGSLFAISQISLSSGTNGAGATSSAQISAYLDQVGKAITSVTTASETLGAAASNIDLQSTYTSSLSASLTSGVGSLVDADMNEASTRLNALQTQQQLGVQALSVANQNSQLILKLFQ